MKILKQYAGRMKIVRTSPTRGVTDFGWSKNTIVDTGLDAIGRNLTFLAYCKLGSGSTPVTNDDIDLESVMSIAGGINFSAGASNVAPYYGWRRRRYTFVPGTATGILREVGIFWGTGAQMFSRALLKDDAGDPTEIEVLEDEQIDVYYDLRAYSPVLDGEPTIVDLSTDGSGFDHTFSGRAAYASNSGYWAPNDASISLLGYLYDGSMGSVTGRPSGNSYERTGGETTPDYVDGSYQKSYILTWNQSVVMTVRSVMIWSSLGTFQFNVSPSIEKTALNRLELEITFEWGRYA